LRGPPGRLSIPYWLLSTVYSRYYGGGEAPLDASNPIETRSPRPGKTETHGDF
jgi:hypothetical protein